MSKMIMRRVHNTCVNMVRMGGCSIFGGDIWVALVFAEHCFEVIQKGTKISPDDGVFGMGVGVCFICIYVLCLLG